MSSVHAVAPPLTSCMETEANLTRSAQQKLRTNKERTASEDYYLGVDRDASADRSSVPTASCRQIPPRHCRCGVRGRVQEDFGSLRNTFNEEASKLRHGRCDRHGWPGEWVVSAGLHCLKRSSQYWRNRRWCRVVAAARHSSVIEVYWKRSRSGREEVD